MNVQYKKSVHSDTDQLTFNCSLSIVNDPLPLYFWIFFTEKNMERLSDILASCPSAAQPQSSSASSWSFRQQKASERWKEARPYHLKCLVSKEAVGLPLCWLCNEPAVIRLVFINTKLQLPRVGLLSALLYWWRYISFEMGEDLDTQMKNTLMRKVNLGPSCCEVTVLNTDPLCNPLQLNHTL